MHQKKKVKKKKEIKIEWKICCSKIDNVDPKKVLNNKSQFLECLFAHNLPLKIHLGSNFIFIFMYI